MKPETIFKKKNQQIFRTILQLQSILFHRWKNWKPIFSEAILKVITKKIINLSPFYFSTNEKKKKKTTTMRIIRKLYKMLKFNKRNPDLHFILFICNLVVCIVSISKIMCIPFWFPFVFHSISMQIIWLLNNSRSTSTWLLSNLLLRM